MDDGEDLVGLSWQEQLERIEDLHYYEDTYFWDFDFMLLDSHTEDELLDRPVSEYMIIERFFLFFNNIHQFTTFVLF